MEDNFFNEFSRIRDNSYSFYVEGENNKHINVIINSDLGDVDKKTYELSEKIANHLKQKSSVVLNKENLYIETGGSKYLLKRIDSEPSEKTGLISFFRDVKDKNSVEYVLKKVSFWKNESDLKDVLESSSMPKIQINQPLFSDPYTELSALAFQKHEPYYDCHDPSEKKDFSSKCVIIKKDDQLTLVQKNQKLDKKELQQTFQGYVDFLIKMYGQEKIQYIDKCYGLDLKECIENCLPLTPEIVYKINMGLGNLEVQDVKLLYEKLGKLNSKLIEISEGNSLFQSCLEMAQPALDFMVESNVGLTFFEIKGIYQSLTAGIKNPTTEDLFKCLKELDFEKPIEKLGKVEFNTLVKVLLVSDKDRERQYTGRKIDKPIQSDYTTAGKKNFKPWVDQQELIQIFPSLKEDGWDNYYEKLCFVVCKKHLVRLHPTENYRIGALIPAPNDKDGNSQWYKVAQFVNNGHGIVSYVLVPALDSFDLPAIKLYRSTASDSSAMDGMASALNDINPINPPGYEGSYLSESIEEKFFNDRSIPVWVGYQHQAELMLEALDMKDKNIFSKIEDIYKNLKASTEELQLLEMKNQKSSGLIKFIKKYDAAFLELLKQVHFAEKKPEVNLNRLSIVFENRNRIGNAKRLIAILTQDENEPSNYFVEKNIEDAKFILGLIEDLPEFKGRDLVRSKLKKEIIKLSKLKIEPENSEERFSTNTSDSENSNIETENFEIESKNKEESNSSETIVFYSDEEIFRQKSDSMDSPRPSRKNTDEEIFREKFDSMDSPRPSRKNTDKVILGKIFETCEKLDEIKSNKKDPDLIVGTCNLLNRQISDFSRLRKEDIKSKIQQPVILAGHSLGGACAQKGLVQYITDKKRIPLPGQEVSLRLFADPGIRHSDNQSFKDFGCKHSNLLEKQKSKFNIFRRQTQGDLVVAGGEEHLGATFKDSEENDVAKWLYFDGRIQLPHSESESKLQASSSITHAMQFSKSKKGPSLLMIKNAEQNPEDYDKFIGDFREIKYSMGVQGAFDQPSKIKDKKARKFIEKSWNLMVSSENAEKIRKNIGLNVKTVKLLDKGLNYLLLSSNEQKKLHGEWEGFCNSDGVFAVDETGIIKKDEDN